MRLKTKKKRKKHVYVSVHWYDTVLNTEIIRFNKNTLTGYISLL